MGKVSAISKDQLKNAFNQKAENETKTKCAEIGYQFNKHGYFLKLSGGGGKVFKDHIEPFASYIDAVDRFTYLAGKHGLKLQKPEPSEILEAAGLSVSEIKHKKHQRDKVKARVERLELELKTYQKIVDEYDRELSPYLTEA